MNAGEPDAPAPTTATSGRRRAGALLAAAVALVIAALFLAAWALWPTIRARRTIAAWRAAVVTAVPDLEASVVERLLEHRSEGEGLLDDEAELDEDDPTTQPWMAGQTLREKLEPVLQPGRDLLANPSPELRAELREKACHDEDEILRTLAFLHLDALDDAQLIDVAERIAASDPTIRLRLRAVRALGEARRASSVDVLHRLFDHPDRALRRAVRRELRWFGPAVTPILLGELATIDDVERRRQRIVFILGEHARPRLVDDPPPPPSLDDGRSLVPTLLPILASRDEADRLRAAAASVLAAFDRVDAIAPLIETLDEERIRARAILALAVKDALARLGEPAVASLVATLADEATAPRHRRNVVWALAWVGAGDDARAAVLASLGDADAGVREEAVRAAVRTGGASVADALRSLLDDPDAAVVDAATRGLDDLDPHQN